MRYFLLGALAGALLFVIALLDNAFAASAAAVASPVPSFPTRLTASDLTNLREICGLAQRSEKLTLEQATGVGTYCQDLLVRLGTALSTPQPASAPEAPKESN